MNLTIGSVRTLDKLARSVGNQLMIDSAEIAKAMNDSVFNSNQDTTKQPYPAFLSPILIRYIGT